MKIWEKMNSFIERKSKAAIAMLVAVTLVLSLMPLTAFAAEYDGWSDGETISTGTYDLNGATITVSGKLIIDGEVTVKNGKIIRGTGFNNEIFAVGSDDSLTLEEVILDGGAVWSGAEDAVLGRGTTNTGITSVSPLIDAGYQRVAGGHVTLNAGVILQNNACSDSGSGGAITVGEDGSLVINGAIIRNNAKTAGQAGAIKAYAGAQITMNSGEISGNNAYTHGGAIQIFGNDSTDREYAVFTMNGGTIRNNKAGGVGGAVAVSNYSEFVMNGGRIEENATTDSSKRGGGVGFADADTKMTVAGNAVIAGNKAGGVENNLYIGTNSCNLVTVDEMQTGASIGVTLKNATGVFSNGGAKYADKNYFVSDKSDYAVAADGVNLKIEAHTHTTGKDENRANCQHGDICDLCGTEYVDIDESKHIYDSEIGITCRGRFCTVCKTWYGIKNTDHYDGTLEYIPVNGGEHTPVWSCCGKVEDNEECKNTSVIVSDDGASCTERCDDCKADLGKLEIVAPEHKIYGDGKAAHVTVKVDGSDWGEVHDAVYYQLLNTAMFRLDDVPTGAGRFRAENKWTIGGIDVILYVEYEISKADIDLDTLVNPVFAADLVYDGTAQALVSTNGSVEGGTIVYSLSENGEYTADFPVATEVGSYRVYWYVQGDKNHNDYGESDPFVTTVHITDTTDPTGVILIEENSWKQFWNWISFGLFCKENVDVIVTADGTGSAVERVEYLFSATALDEHNLPADDWKIVEGNNGTYTFTVTAQNKGAVYVRITDAYGNVAVINSGGIVVYTDSVALSDSIVTTYKAGVDKSVAIKLNGNLVKDIRNGNTKLDSDDYEISLAGDVLTLTLKASYLDTLNAGSYTFTVSYNPLGAIYDYGMDGEESANTDISVVIHKAESSVTNISNLDKTYDGSAVSAPTYNVVGDGTVTVEYKLKDAEDSAYTPDAPKDAGKYVVRISVSATENYNAASETAEFEIAKKSVTVMTTAPDKVYDGTNAIDESEIVLILNGLVAGDSVDVSIKEAWYNGASAGTDKIVPIVFNVTGEDAKNYTFPTGAEYVALDYYVEALADITQKEIGISWDATQFIPYDGMSKVPSATATGLVAGDICTLTTEVVETTEGAGVIPGVWTARVTDLSNPNYKLPASVTASFEIINGSQNDAPVVSGVNETVDGKGDGKITGADSTMEYRKDGESTYTAVTGSEIANLHDGTYYVRYAAKTYYNPSPEAQVTIGAGRKLTVTVPQNQVGYTLTVDKTEIEYMGGPTITLIIHDGYSKTEGFSVKLNGVDMQWGDFTQLGTQSCTEDVVITVEGIADITAPAAEISITESKWTTFWNNITFGLFFNETQDVTISATDLGSGVNSIQYYLANGELTLEEVKQIATWEDYDGAFKINPDNKYLVYAKVTDNAGNVLYLNSDGVVLDKTAAVISGVENGETYYGNTEISVTDALAGVKEVKVDGSAVTLDDGKFTIIADNAEHTVVVADNSGNAIEYKVTVMKNYTVTYKVDGEIVSTETVGHGKDANIPAVPAKDGYVGKWNADGKNITADTVIEVAYTAAPVVAPESVNPEDKSELEDTKKQLEDLLNDESYTEDDKKNIQDAIDSIDDALEVIGNIKNVEDKINALPENITKDDTDDVDAAKKAYDELSDYEKTLIDPEAKKKLDDAVKAAEEANKPADTNSPQTGDNSNMTLWFTLMFGSIAVMFTILFGTKKKKAEDK